MQFLNRGLVAVAGMAVLAACGTPMTEQAQSIRIVTAAEKDARCESLGVIAAEQSLGPTKWATR
jgi:hypothetical protein